MKSMIKDLGSIGLIMLSFLKLSAQSPDAKLKEPEVGKPCPAFKFNILDFYKNKTVSLADLKGKWVILDFWSTHCSGCIASLPYISRGQLEFGNKVQFIMVDGDGDLVEERKFYANYQHRLNLSMPSAFDKSIKKDFNVSTEPHVIIVDPNGIVKVITSETNRDKIKRLIENKEVAFSPPIALREKMIGAFPYDYSKPLAVNGNGEPDSDFVFRTLLSNWSPQKPYRWVDPEGALNIARMGNSSLAHIDNMPVSLMNLYSLAYLGIIRPRDRNDPKYDTSFFQKPVFEISDTDQLKFDRATGKHGYCYSLVVPTQKCNDQMFMETTRQDLKHFFGYEVSIETRIMPYWKLIANKSAISHLKSSGANILSKDSYGGTHLSLKNVPISQLLNIIDYDLNMGNGEPLLDETGITTNIDIELEWAKEYGVARAALQQNGLDLVKGEKEMKVVVVRDPKPEKIQ